MRIYLLIYSSSAKTDPDVIRIDLWVNSGGPVKRINDPVKFITRSISCAPYHSNTVMYYTVLYAFVYLILVPTSADLVRTSHPVSPDTCFTVPLRAPKLVCASKAVDCYITSCSIS